MKNIFYPKGKFKLVFRKVFFFILDGKYFFKIIKDFKISCYLLIISNLILKLFIAIYFILNLFFLISSF